MSQVFRISEAGVTFRDISRWCPMVKHTQQQRIKLLNTLSKGVEMIVSPEARGFIVGCPVAYKLGVGLHLLVEERDCRREQFQLAMV